MKSYTKFAHLFILIFMYSLDPFDVQGKVIDRWTHVRVKIKSELCGQKTWSFFFFLVFCLLRATPMAYGDLQAMGLRAVASGLPHSHSNARSEPRL